MRMFVIYRNPKDFPGKVVVRGFTITAEPQPSVDPEPLFVADSTPGNFAAARRAIREQGNYLSLQPDPDDDPVIAEVWL